MKFKTIYSYFTAGLASALGNGKGTQIALPGEQNIDDLKTVTTDGALQISSVFACAELLANTISTLPLFVYETKKGSERVEARASQLWFLLHDSPNQWMTPTEFLSTMVMNRLIRGNAYALIQRNDAGTPIALIPLSAEQVEVQTENGEAFYIYRTDGETYVYSCNDIVHWKGIGNGYIGLSKLEFMRASANEAIHAQSTSTKLYSKENKPSGILETDKTLSTAQVDEVKTRFSKMGRETNGNLYIVDQGLKFTPVSLTPEDAQLLQTRQFTVEEICRWFGVPPVLVGGQASTTWGSGIEQIILGFHKFTIAPLCVQLQQALAKRLVSVTEPLTIEFKFDSFLRSSPAERSTYYATLAQNGVMTRNEIRRLENLSPVDGGDELTAQTNLAPISQLGQGGAAQGGAGAEIQPIKQ